MFLERGKKEEGHLTNQRGRKHMAMKKDFKAEVLALAESMVGIPEGAFKVLHSKQECYCFDTGIRTKKGARCMLWSM